MKRIVITLFAAIAVINTAAAQDTTLMVGNRRIELTDNGERYKVKVFEDNNGRSVENELLFEGQYRNGQSYERRRRSINIQLPTWKNYGFEPHLAGFSFGFSNFSDKGIEHINDIDGVSLHSGKSMEFTLIPLDAHIRLWRRSPLAIVMGLGMRWNTYSIDGNSYFEEVDGITGLTPAHNMELLSSRMNVTSIIIPIMLELQTRNELFISAGVEGIMKTYSSSRITYKKDGRKKRNDKVDGGMNLRPISMDFVVRAGYSWIGLYARYSPISNFESAKGPKLYPVSAGIQLNF
jgi:hypothetical protein